VAKEETRLGATFSGLVDTSARQHRVVSAQRGDVLKLLGGNDVRELADADTELRAALERHTQLLTAAEQAGAAWQKDLAAAAKQWEALLAELARLRDDSE
jgi:hypothetical protein